MTTANLTLPDHIDKIVNQAAEDSEPRCRYGRLESAADAVLEARVLAQKLTKADRGLSSVERDGALHGILQRLVEAESDLRTCLQAAQDHDLGAPYLTAEVEVS